MARGPARAGVPGGAAVSYENPVLRLESTAKLQQLSAEARAALASVLREIGLDAAIRAEESWRRNKGPMAAYWKAVGVYARHIARSIDRG